ncbi:hypothetical protein [Haloferula sp.]|uniref:hypothetical protein n=1 Tax=Haloferula sp. TaxID=2497595 RepID=UPI003C757A39
MKTLLKKTREPYREQGFALIVVISMLLLLALLVTGLLSLSTLSLRNSRSSLAQAEAQANARMALMIAIGEVQKHLGPDQRISARGDVMAKDPRVGATIGESDPKAWWVGVANGDPDEMLADGKPVAWLVSGLNPSSDPASQIQGDFSGDPVPIFAAESLDLQKYSGGKEITAGRVAVLNSANETTGSYAWMVDDDGMKAQLAPSNRLASNEQNAGRGVLGSGYDLTILTGLTGLTDQTPDSLAKLNSIDDLEFLGAPKGIGSSARFDYTTRSIGVLSDVRNGGLKKDLTIAFENATVFREAFPSSDSDKYILMDPEKYADASDLKSSGYINFDIFNAHYNLKRYLLSERGNPTIYPISLDKDGFYNSNLKTGDYYVGALGPHEINPRNSKSGIPYGDFSVLDTRKNQTRYRNSPVTPILQYLQMNGWVEQTRDNKLQTHTQLFTSHYNPYNVSLKIEGETRQPTGARVINFPNPQFSVSGSFSNQAGMDTKRQCHGPAVTVPPGRSQVYGFSNDVNRGSERDDQAYTPNISRVSNQSVLYKVSNSSAPSPGATLTVEFAMDRPALCSGNDEDQGPHEVSQFFFTPFAIDNCSGFPGVRRVLTEIGPSAKASVAFGLRTTTEGDPSSVRPLIDSNIRAIWNNPKWDSPLNLPVLAGYSLANNLQPPSPLPQLDISQSPAAFTYWGGDRSANFGYDRVILFDIPQQDLVSLGQLQHAGAGRFSYEPTYIVGNSYANPRIPKDSWRASIRDTFSTSNPVPRSWAISGNFNLYDASFLVNEALWDSYIFTTIPQNDDNFAGDDVPADYAAILNGDLLLPNPRFIPYEPGGSKFEESTLRATGDTGGYHVNAGHLVVDGAFNVNSTSVDAWEAFLSGTHRLPVQNINGDGKITGFSSPEDGVRFPRVNATLGKATDASNPDENFWMGFRTLSSEEVRRIAEEVVVEIRKRGPARGLSEFVNRRLESGELGESGPLQAALDRAVNLSIPNSIAEKAANSQLVADSSQATGFPGYLMQGDVLQALSPYMTARSDTFTIRSYGESVEAKTGQVKARAWCEAKLQRYPEPVEAGGGVAASSPEELIEPSSAFGRKFQMTSFRWLSPEEI